MLVGEVDVFVDVVGVTNGTVSVTSPAAGDTYATLCAVPVNPASIVAVTRIVSASAPAANTADDVQVSPTHE